MKKQDILYELFSMGQMTLSEYLKFQELPSDTIKKFKEYINKNNYGQ